MSRSIRALPISRRLFFAMLAYVLCAGCRKARIRRLISDVEASKYIGREVTVRGRIADVNVSRRGRILLTFGGRPPDETLILIVFEGDRGKFTNVEKYRGRTVEVRGLVRKFGESPPRITLKSESQIRIVE